MATKKKQVKRQPPKQTKQDREHQAAIQRKLDSLMLRRVSTRGPQDLMPDPSDLDRNKE